MSTWFVSRHPGAIDWMKNQSIEVDHWVTHLNLDNIHKGDNIIGILPVELAAQVCAKGAHFIALSYHAPENLRGKELSAEILEQLGCRLIAFSVNRLEDDHDRL